MNRKRKELIISVTGVLLLLLSAVFCYQTVRDAIIDNEKESIKRYGQGEALFVCGNKRMRINVIATEQELDSFGSGGGL